MTLSNLRQCLQNVRKSDAPWWKKAAAFTLVEMLLVVAIISILASLAISSFSDAAQTSREVVANQQLAVWQSALNNWVNSKLGRKDSTIDPTGNYITLERLRTYYNSRSPTQRFTLIAGKDLDANTPDVEAYLDPMTAEHYVQTAISEGRSNLDQFRSDAMLQTGRYLTLPSWTAGSYPQVEIH